MKNLIRLSFAFFLTILVSCKQEAPRIIPPISSSNTNNCDLDESITDLTKCIITSNFWVYKSIDPYVGDSNFTSDAIFLHFDNQTVSLLDIEGNILDQTEYTIEEIKTIEKADANGQMHTEPTSFIIRVDKMISASDAPSGKMAYILDTYRINLPYDSTQNLKIGSSETAIWSEPVKYYLDRY